MADSPRKFDRKSFQEWKANPLTGAFLALLAAQRSVLLEQWGRGLSMDPTQQTKASLWGQLASLHWPDVREMYEEIDAWREHVRLEDAEPPEEIDP